MIEPRAGQSREDAGEATMKTVRHRPQIGDVSFATDSKETPSILAAIAAGLAIRSLSRLVNSAWRAGSRSFKEASHCSYFNRASDGSFEVGKLDDTVQSSCARLRVKGIQLVPTSW